MNPTQKIAEIYKQMRLGEAKKMDPVGKADADIDNDGDVDKSDEYLHNRRKAIKKSMKEEKCDECGKEPCECDDKDEMDEASCKSKKEAVSIDPDDGEVTKAKDTDKKKKKTTDTETSDSSVSEAALTVGMKQPVDIDDTEEKGHMDAVKANKAGPGKAKEPKAKKLKELRK